MGYPVLGLYQTIHQAYIRVIDLTLDSDTQRLAKGISCWDSTYSRVSDLTLNRGIQGLAWGIRCWDSIKPYIRITVR